MDVFKKVVKELIHDFTVDGTTVAKLIVIVMCAIAIFLIAAHTAHPFFVAWDRATDYLP